MDISQRIFLKLLGTVFIIFSIITIIQAVFSIIFGLYFDSNREFLYSTLFLLISQSLYFLGKKLEKINVDMKEINNRPYIALAFVPFVWIIIPLIGSIPYYIEGIHPLDAYFDSMSAFTTVGISTVDPSKLPYSLIFWRSLEQWIGGIGIVFLSVLILSKSWFFRKVIMLEGLEELDPGLIKKYLKATLLVYTILTIFGMSLLYLTGYPLFISLNLAMACISTGGMIPAGISFSSIQKAIASSLMIYGALGPLFIANMITNFRKSIRYLPSLIFLGYLFLVPIPISLRYDIPYPEIFFHLTSAMSTTGIYTTKINEFPPPVIFILMISMAIGGLTGSTSGGMKMERLLSIVDGIKKFSKRILSPEEETKKIDFPLLLSLMYLLSYTLLVILGTSFFLIFTEDVLNAEFLSVSVASSGFPPISPKSFTNFEKVFAIFLFWAGRLEVFPIFAFLPAIYKLIKR